MNPWLWGFGASKGNFKLAQWALKMASLSPEDNKYANKKMWNIQKKQRHDMLSSLYFCWAPVLDFDPGVFPPGCNIPEIGAGSVEVLKVELVRPWHPCSHCILQLTHLNILSKLAKNEKYEWYTLSCTFGCLGTTQCLIILDPFKLKLNGQCLVCDLMGNLERIRSCGCRWDNSQEGEISQAAL